MTPNERQARNDGSAARLQGEPPSANPHPMGHSLSRQWSLGWRTMDAEADVPPVRGAA